MTAGMTWGAIQFRNVALSEGWVVIHVIQGSTMLGSITHDARTGRYRFFEGAENSLAYAFEGSELAELKARVVERFGTSALDPVLTIKRAAAAKRAARRQDRGDNVAGR